LQDIKENNDVATFYTNIVGAIHDMAKVALGEESKTCKKQFWWTGEI
jgi:hypothetical protein